MKLVLRVFVVVSVGACGSVGGNVGVDAAVCAAPSMVCDGTCVNPTSDNQNCGTCGNACPAGEACDGMGTCAATCHAGFLTCEGACSDPMTDDHHCGATSDCTGANAGVDCTMTDQTCVSGVCDYPGHVRYETTFMAGVVPTAQQCTDYQAFWSKLDGNFAHMRIYGDSDPAGQTGYTCDDPTVTTQLAAAMKAGTSLVVTCGTQTWQFCSPASGNIAHGGEFWVNAPGGALCSGSNCSGAGQAMVRGCIDLAGDGAGVNVTSCTGPTQHVVIDFQRAF